MDRFDWKARLTKPFSAFPEYREKPVIGITSDYEDGRARLAEGYYKSVEKAGGVPVIIPPLCDNDVIISTLEGIDSLILSGGGDINPLFCGEEPSPFLHSINDERDLPELLLTRLAYNRHIPILGICKGIQTLIMALGGRVAQDIDEEFKGKDVRLLKHSQDAPKSEPTHSVNLEKGSILRKLYNKEKIAVNSFHHQSVANPGDLFRIAAKAPDGVIEAIESSEFRDIIGVQWHPECLDEGAPIFSWIVEKAAEYRKIQRLHDRIISLDSHCDTPMFFPKGVDISVRDPRLLVDLHKMDEGRLDASVMVSYLPQPKGSKSFEEINGISPKLFAVNIFDKIGEMAEKNPETVLIARTPLEVLQAKREGRKAILLGIENGIALEDNPANVEFFAKKGVIYITLCHNGDNSLCDSAKGTGTHNGLSDLGKRVIREMNKWGIMVDLSHASEKSFWNALEFSKAPIICSHSSCRALCDNPRNLTDEQMKALAESGGVCQITAYSGFLKKDGIATIDDLILHLEHAINLMGIEHVGVGTDFDGDGGVVGFADASYMTNLTKRLIFRGFSEENIKAVMGGNFLRVMQMVQEARTETLSFPIKNN